MSMYVCVSVCPRGYLRSHTRDLYQFLCILPMSVAGSSSATLTIGRIAYRCEGSDGSAQRGRSVIYNCLVSVVKMMYLSVELCFYFDGFEFGLTSVGTRCTVTETATLHLS